MTRKELDQIYYLDKDIERVERIIVELRESVQPKSQKITGMPFDFTGSTSNPTADVAEKIVHYEDILTGYIDAVRIRKAALTDEINQITDPMLRQIISARCLELLSWEDVAARVGAGTTPDSCRMMLHRAFPE